MDSRITISLESPPDRERLVSSILVDHVQLIEINQENDELIVEVHPTKAYFASWMA